MIEEVVDSLLLIVMAKNGVNALRVTPAFNLRTSLLLGVGIGAAFGFLQIADQATFEPQIEGEKERGGLVGNSTAASVSC